MLSGGDDERLDRLRLFLTVVSGDGVDDRSRAAQPLGDVRADQRVWSLHLVVDRLADVVQQTSGLCDLTSAPSSPASAPAISDISSECCNTFWP